MKVFLKKWICELNHRLGRFDDTLFLLGDGRSGTTWIEEVLNFDKRYRELFEPFHGRNGFKLDHGGHYPYQTDADEPAYQKHLRDALRGAFINLKVSYTIPRAFFSGLFIKDISAHFILDSIYTQKPDGKYLMILRHPFAVALSKSKAWEWHTDLASFLSDLNPQRELLEPYRQILEVEHDPLLVYVIVWCVLHQVAFQSRAISTFDFVFYEHLAADPEREFERLFEVAGDDDIFATNQAAIHKAIRRKSRLTTQADHSIAHSKEGRSKWMDEWSKEQVQEGIQILNSFGLDFLYGDGHFPQVTAQELKEKLSSAS